MSNVHVSIDWMIVIFKQLGICDEFAEVIIMEIKRYFFNFFRLTFFGFLSNTPNAIRRIEVGFVTNV